MHNFPKFDETYKATHPKILTNLTQKEHEKKLHQGASYSFFLKLKINNML